jgi:hypothetical protein
MKGIESSMEWMNMFQNNPVSRLLQKVAWNWFMWILAKPARGDIRWCLFFAKLKNSSDQTFGTCGHQAQQRVVWHRWKPSTRRKGFGEPNSDT